METVISLLGITQICAMLILILKYIFLPHYRFLINSNKLKELSESIEKLHDMVYVPYKNGTSIKQCILQAKTDTAFGCENYFYKDVFLLFDRDVVNIRRDVKALAIVKKDLHIDYEDKKIYLRNRYQTKQSIIKVGNATILGYLALSVLVILSQSVLKATFISSSWFVGGIFILIFILVFMIRYYAYFKDIEYLIES